MFDMKVGNILHEIQSRIEQVKPIESKQEGLQTVSKLMKRIKRLDRQSEKINHPVYSGYNLDPQLNTAHLEPKDGDATDSSMLMGLGMNRANAKKLFVDELTER